MRQPPVLAHRPAPVIAPSPPTRPTSAPSAASPNVAAAAAAAAAAPSSSAVGGGAARPEVKAINTLKRALAGSLTQFAALFTKMDRDKSGSIDRDEFYRAMKVYKKVPRRIAYEKTGRAPIKVKWVDHNKGTAEKPEIRSRLVAKDVRVSDRPELFAATPPLEALKLLLSIVASAPGRTRCSCQEHTSMRPRPGTYSLTP